MQKTLVFEMPENIINKIMDKDEKFKIGVKVEFKNLKKSFLVYFILNLSGKRNKNRITFILDDKSIDNYMAEYLCKEDYTVYFSYDMLNNKNKIFAPKEENNFYIEKDKDFYFVKIDYDGKQVFSKGFKDENEFKDFKSKDKFCNYIKTLDSKDDFKKNIKKIRKIITALIVLSIILVAVMFVTLGLFTGGVAPAIFTPLIAKCLIGVFGGIGGLGFFASWFMHRKGKTIEKSINLAQDDINNLQNGIDDLGEKDNKLNDNEKNNNGFEIPKSEGEKEKEKDNENEYGS